MILAWGQGDIDNGHLSWCFKLVYSEFLMSILLNDISCYIWCQIDLHLRVKVKLILPTHYCIVLMFNWFQISTSILLKKLIFDVFDVLSVKAKYDVSDVVTYIVQYISYVCLAQTRCYKQLKFISYEAIWLWFDMLQVKVNNLS